MSDAAQAHFVELASLTKIDADEWRRICSLPPDLAELAVANYRDQDWARPGASTLDRVLAVLGIIGTIAGVVGGVAGAAGAVRALTGH